MGKNFLFISIVLSLGVSGTVFSQSKDEDFRKKWKETEEEYSAEYTRKAEEKDRKEYVQMFFDLGKEYYYSQDYPSALVSFNRVVELEAEGEDKELTPLTEDFLEEIDKRILRQIEEECSLTCDKDLRRIRQGIDEILAQNPVVVFEPPEPEEEQEEDEKLAEIRRRRKELFSQRKELGKDKAIMRLKLKKAILTAKKEIEEIIFVNRGREIGDKHEARARMLTVRELYRKKKYEKALKEIEVILALDPYMREAKQIKNFIEKKMAREKERAERARYRKAKKRRMKERLVAQRKEREEALKRRKEEAEETQRREKISRLLKKAEKEILKEQYRDAGTTLKDVLEIEPDNNEAFRLLDYIKIRVEEIAENATPDFYMKE